MRLTWHNYRYYPYERYLATREITALLGSVELNELKDGVELRGSIDCDSLARLTYFSGTINSRGYVPTTQAELEREGRNGKNKQVTRYSVHGLHEYKGKFNPQVVRALLNMFQIESGQRVFDPFCGSGTTLVECAHLGAVGVGTDVNPLATMIAKTKLQALHTPSETLWNYYHQIKTSLTQIKYGQTPGLDDLRGAYLKSWFDNTILSQIEVVRQKIEEITGIHAPIFLIIASNLLREYSQQDPKDLRIRRRKTSLPEKPFVDAFLEAVLLSFNRIEAAQKVLGTRLSRCEAILCDVKDFTSAKDRDCFDAAITSPPYAMALPYIDTQRLSLVWLGLLSPDRILELESELIGSREMRGQARRVLPSQLQDNSEMLPPEQARLCLDLHHALGEGDGFRRRAVPVLLYRYFAAMKSSFRAVKSVMKPGALYGLIVGHNHTTIGGVRHDIDTPSHLASLARSECWHIEEVIPLQTYRRYGYHVSNAVGAETLIILRND